MARLVSLNAGIDNSMNPFLRWLERRNPALLLPKSAKQYAASLNDPVLIRRTQRKIETDSELLRRSLGLKNDRRSNKRRGL